jgi:hypothetical protein
MSDPDALRRRPKDASNPTAVFLNAGTRAVFKGEREVFAGAWRRTDGGGR